MWSRDKLIAMQKIYEFNETRKIGDIIVCPVCGKSFIKQHYQQKFHSTLCKDRYWNMIKGKGRICT